ncbi:MAG: valine--tRNA ligase [Desulfobacterales bacterium]
MKKGYAPEEVETKWYEYWENNGLFAASEDSEKKPYSIVIPPPNVTGVLHMGHSLNITLQDILCRYRRLRGDNVLWMPGTDHAGIATQNVVERNLAEKGIDRHQIGREKFVEAVWEWRRKYGDAIINQLKRLGASCDWDRERFTMDEGLSRAVRKVFVELYEAGLIYRGNYIINWCPRCQTALAELEVEHEESDGHIYHIHYPMADGGDGPIVATTRPETMLGDTAVAVHPEDGRYQHLHGKSVQLPLTGRDIPVITDAYVDVSFGTGALKITPAHDPNDFEIGKTHDLPSVKVIGEDGRMTEAAGAAYAGLDRFECRRRVVADLKDQGLLKKVEDYKHSIGHCYRCQTLVEPNLSKQWFVRTRPLAEKAVDAVKNGETCIVPEKWQNDYYKWMENIRDWCISRQIWWGHPIPAWKCADCGHLAVAFEDPKICPACESDRLEPDSDVLDTWFSSALWPFSTMGWPDQTKLLQTFYPTSVLVTGFDILFFWVARMMMMGCHFMQEVPFKDVYVHALVRDENGKKMSKSSGNVIDPMVIIEEYGTDALRFTLAAFAAQGRDIKLSEKRIEGYRNFINKLWNAARLTLMHVTEKPNPIDPAILSLADRWMLSRLNTVTHNMAEAIDGYHFNTAANEIYQFVWHEFCDWYLEAAKPALYGKWGEDCRQAALSVSWRVLHETLILLHAFIPFVTEEIWHLLPGTQGSIMEAVYPSDAPDFDQIKKDPAAEADMDLVIEIITGIRNIRGEMNIAPSLNLSVLVQTDNADYQSLIRGNQELIASLARLESLDAARAGEKPKATATAIVADMVISVYLEGVIDFAKESQRLEKEIGKLDKELQALSKKLENENFISKAPAEVIEKARSQHSEYMEKKEKLKNNLHMIQTISQ